MQGYSLTDKVQQLGKHKEMGFVQGHANSRQKSYGARNLSGMQCGWRLQVCCFEGYFISRLILQIKSLFTARNTMVEVSRIFASILRPHKVTYVSKTTAQAPT